MAEAFAPEAARVAVSVAAFVGVIAQVPPAYSAAKVSGRRAYDLARRGENVTLRPRSVRIDVIQILDYSYPHLELEIHCGKGTYIRSLARDLGERLGCGAFVQTLRRTRVGPFTTEEALTLDADAETARARLLPAEMAVAELPRVVLSEDDLKRLCQGQDVLLGARSVSEGTSALAYASGSEEFCTAVFDSADRLVGIAVFDPHGKRLHPAKVLQSK